MEHLPDHLKSNPMTLSYDYEHSPPTSQSRSQDHPQFTTKPKNANDITFLNAQPANVPPSPSRAGNLTPTFPTPLGNPLRTALSLTKLDPTDEWLPITQSRNGNAYYAAFHTLCSGIGVQSLVLPFAFAVLGWIWGIIALSLAFIWQLYTLYLLVNLHESPESGVRYSRYTHLAYASLGKGLGNVLALFPVIYISLGTCIVCTVMGATASKMFFQTVCDAAKCHAHTLTTVEWYLVFICGAIVLSQLPTLNSLAGTSLVGGIAALGYCSIIWAVSVSEGRIPNVSYDPVRAGTKVLDILNALGIIVFAFTGHNLILEIQGTMPTSKKYPSAVPMWKGVKMSYTLIAMCLFSLAIGGYWAYGNLIPSSGILTALLVFHTNDEAKSLRAITSMLLIIGALCSFQLYGMQTFDMMESIYMTKFKKPCTWWLRVIMRLVFGFSCFFVAVSIQYLGSLGSLFGGITLPVTLAYPCFMWLKINKPKVYSPKWCLNWGLGVLGMILSGVLISAGVYVLIHDGVKIYFFKP